MVEGLHQLLKENTFVAAEGMLWNIRQQREDSNYFRWHSKTFGLSRWRTLRSLEEDELENRTNEEDENKTLAEFAANTVIKKQKHIKKQGKALERIINNTFICEGVVFYLSQERKPNHEIRVEGKNYSIGNLLTEERFENKPRKTNTPTPEKFYDKTTNIGFERNDRGSFIYTTAEPYVLYERENNKYYRFGEAKIGIELKLEGNDIKWHDAVVMNNYIHPALPGEGAYQKICTGKFSYNTIREKYSDLGDQIRVALQKARNIIESGYFSSKGAWNELTDPKYKGMETRPRGRITNT